jgi:hypothetical protein
MQSKIREELMLEQILVVPGPTCGAKPGERTELGFWCDLLASGAQPKISHGIENDFQKGCRKGAEFAAYIAFSAIIGELSCLFSLALEFLTRFRQRPYNN